MPQATVMNKNRPIFTCEMDDSGNLTKLGEVIPKNAAFLPLCLWDDKFSPANVSRWIYKRKVPRVKKKETDAIRVGIEEVNRNFNNPAIYHHMFSLSDQYWFKYKKNEKWESLNYFEHAYQKEYGKMFFSPWNVDEDAAKCESPDMVTNGMLKKRWIQPYIENGDYTSYLLKSGSRSFRQEPISEVLASMFLDRLNFIDHVRYDFAIDGLSVVSICKNFVTKDTELIPASHVFNLEKMPKAENDGDNEKEQETSYAHMVRMCERVGIDRKTSTDYLDRMLAADYALCNKDRNYGNFGLIRDVNSGKITGFAPLFDSGQSFLWADADKIPDEKYLYSEMDAAAGRVIAAQPHLHGSINVKKMHDIVETYPGITEEDKKVVKSNIDAICARLKSKIPENTGDVMEFSL